MSNVLHLLHFIGYKMYHIKLLKIFFQLCFCLYLTFVIVEIFFLISNPSISHIINYGTAFLQMCWVILGLFAHFMIPDLLDEMLSFIELWPIGKAGVKIEGQILKEVRIINTYVVFNTILGLLFATLFVYPSDDDIKTVFFAVLVKKWIPQHQYSILFSFKLFAYFGQFVAASHSYQVIYVTQIVKFQMYLFNGMAEDIGKVSGKQNENIQLTEDRQYQNEVQFKLKTLVKRHCELLRFLRCSLKIMKNWIVPFSLGGCFIGVSIALGFFQTTEHSLLKWRTVIFAIFAISTFAGLIMSAQKFQDETERMRFVFTQNNWYTWNKKNQQILCMILNQTTNPMKMKFTENIAVNYELGMAICRIIYAAVNVFYKLQ